MRYKALVLFFSALGIFLLPFAVENYSPTLFDTLAHFAIVLVAILAIIIAAKLVAYFSLRWHQKMLVFVIVGTTDCVIYAFVTSISGFSASQIISQLFPQILGVQMDKANSLPPGFMSLWAILVITAAVVSLGYHFLERSEVNLGEKDAKNSKGEGVKGT